MSGSLSLPTPYLNCTHYAWTETQTAANYEASGCGATIAAMDSVMYNSTMNRCDVAEKLGVINAQSYAIAAAGG